MSRCKCNLADRERRGRSGPAFPLTRARWLAFLTSFLIALLPRALAYTPKPAPNPVPEQPTGPHYLNLRYDEDYRFLDDHPETRKEDARLWLKNLEIGERWRLDIGGEFRLRTEFRSNQTLGLNPRTSNTQQNYRWMLHANLRYGKMFRLFAQGIVADVEDQDGPFQPTQENHGDVQQLFADVRLFDADSPWMLRVGRQEFSYGNDRLIGPFDWVSTRRRFDAVKLRYSGEQIDFDAFVARPVRVRREQLDRWDDEYNFYGMYATYKGIRNHGLDLYVFASDDDNETRSPNRKVGKLHLYTAGARFWGYAGGFDYDTELAGQWGEWAGDRVNAAMWEIDGGYTFKHPWKPRIGAGFSHTSGDHDPFDGKVSTFNQLFTFNDVCIGILDLIGRQNLTRAYLTADFWPLRDRLMVAAYWHRYWLSAAEDAYYNAGGIPVLRDLAGDSGKQLGQELDIWVEWFLTSNSSVALAYAHFWDEGYVHRRVGTVTGDDDPDLLLLQYRFRF